MSVRWIRQAAGIKKKSLQMLRHFKKCYRENKQIIGRLCRSLDLCEFHTLDDLIFSNRLFGSN